MDMKLNFRLPESRSRIGEQVDILMDAMNAAKDMPSP
jgi:hypothetical protein